MNLVSEDGQTALNLACLENNDAIVTLLLGHGADANKAAAAGGPKPFATACMTGSTSAVVAMLRFGARADLDAGLVLSCGEGHVDTVKVLLAHGAQIAGNETAMASACVGGHYDVVRVLLDTGQPNVDVNAKVGEGGATPLVAAAREGRVSVVKLLLQQPDIRVDETCADDDGGVTALIAACHFGHKEIAALLLAHGADVNKVRAN